MSSPRAISGAGTGRGTNAGRSVPQRSRPLAPSSRASISGPSPAREIRSSRACASCSRPTGPPRRASKCTGSTQTATRYSWQTWTHPPGPNDQEPFTGCNTVVVAGPRTPFAPEESSRLRAWLLQGGSLLAAVGPIDANTDTGMAPAGLDDVLAPFGMALDDDVVHDLDSGVAIPDTPCEGFFASARPHPLTARPLGRGARADP